MLHVKWGGVGQWSALLPRPLYRGPVAKRVALSAGDASLRSVKEIVSVVVVTDFEIRSSCV